MKADAETAKEIDAAIHALTAAYKARDVQALLACFAPDPDVVLYGTGVDEKRTGPEQIRFQAERDWSQTESAELTFASCAASAAGNVAWAALEGAFKLRAAGETMNFPVRASLVFEQREGRWLIAHAHFSSPG